MQACHGRTFFRQVLTDETQLRARQIPVDGGAPLPVDFDAHGLLSLALQDQLLIKINTSQLDAAYDSALRVLDAFQKVQAVSAGRTPSTYIPTPTELEFRTGNIQTIDVRPTGTATRDLTSGQLQNITVNVSTINPTAEVGEAVVTAIRNYNRTSGSAQIGVSRL